MHEQHWKGYAFKSAQGARSACPGLNAMANMGILPADGSFTHNQLYEAMTKEMGFSKPLAYLLTKNAVAGSKTAPASLANIGKEFGDQHVASLTRSDEDGVQYDPRRFQYLVGLAVKDSNAQDVLRMTEVALYKLIVEEHSRQNGNTLGLKHRMLSLINASNVPFLMGRDNKISVADLKQWFEAECIPTTWQAPVGYGFGQALTRAIELRIEMSRVRAEIGEEALQAKVADFRLQIGAAS